MYIYPDHPVMPLLEIENGLFLLDQETLVSYIGFFGRELSRYTSRRFPRNDIYIERASAARFVVCALELERSRRISVGIWIDLSPWQSYRGDSDPDSSTRLGSVPY